MGRSGISRIINTLAYGLCELGFQFTQMVADAHAKTQNA